MRIILSIKASVSACLVTGLAALGMAVSPVWASVQAEVPTGEVSAPPEAVVSGNAAYRVQDFARAHAAYATVSPLELSPLEVNRDAVSLFMTGETRAAEQLLRFAMGRDGDLAVLYNNLGAIRYTQGDYGEAQGYILDALKRYPDNGHFQFNLHSARYARAHRREVDQRREGQPPTALVDRIVGDTIRIAPQLPEEVSALVSELERRGDTYLARKMFDGAAAEYQRLIGMDEQNFPVVHKLALAHHQLTELDRAEDLYREVLDINPYYIPSLNNLGSLEHMRGRPDRAMEYFARVLEIRPDWPMALQNVGLLLFTVERYEEGLAYFLRALALDPSLLERQAPSGLPIVAQSTPANTAMFSYYMAQVAATAGNPDLTMSYLYRAVEEGITDPAMISDPAFGLLSSDERYIALIASLGAP